MSILRQISTKTGRLFINLSHVKKVEQRGKDIIYTFSNSSDIFTMPESANYGTEEAAKNAFDSMMEDLNHYYKVNK